MKLVFAVDHHRLSVYLDWEYISKPDKICKVIMKEQHGLRKGSVHKRFLIGPHPIIHDYIGRLMIPEIIRDNIKQDARLRLDCEKMLVVFIHNILTSPKPLYELSDWLTPIDEGSIGLDQGEARFVTDDRAGKMLELFYSGRHKEVFFRLALRTIKTFDVDCSRVHQDTTTVTLTGRYVGWSAREKLTYGKNKDHRPDLKQLVLGLSVSADGAIPLHHKVYDGNRTDDRLHIGNHQRLRKLLGRSDFVYVADCKLATAGNLKKISSCDGQFVSVMPRTWKEDKKFRKLVVGGKITWRHLLSRRNNRNPDSKLDRYYLADGDYKTSAGYSLLWIKSTQKAEQDKETRIRHLNTAVENLRDLQGRLNKYNLKDRSAIRQAVMTILEEEKCKKYVSFKVSSHRETLVKFKKKGRPRKEEKGKSTWTTYFSLSFDISGEALANAEMCDGIFPLINNLPDNFTPKKVLEIYKFQPFLEKRNSQIKTFQEIAPMYLKKGERVVALLHLHVMALTVATLIERQLRLGMKRNKLSSLPIYPGGLPCKYPTMFDIARLFCGVERYEVEVNDDVMVFPVDLTKEQKQVLKLLEVPESYYH
jgi:transposase